MLNEIKQIKKEIRGIDILIKDNIRQHDLLKLQKIILTNELNELIVKNKLGVLNDG